MSETTDTTAAVDTAAPAEGATLSINDIQNAVRCIDFAAEQGAYKGWNTIEQVLIVRNKLNTFLQSVTPAEAPAEGATADVSSDAPAAE